MMSAVSLRDEQRELTRGKILAAVLSLVAEGALDELSVPAVSRRSGVSLATIYRYYPTKDALLVAASEEPARQALEHVGASEQDGDDQFAVYQRIMWTEFAGNLPLLRHQIVSAAGREMRRARLDRSRELLDAYVGEQGVDPRSEAGARLVSVLLLVGGSLGLLELHDRQGLAVDDAVDVAMWAVHALIEATKRETL
jgi:AcrR family transcriptional regulator